MRFPNIPEAIGYLHDGLKHRSLKIDTGRWQGISTEGRPDMVTYEVTNTYWRAPVQSEDLRVLAKDIKPNLPWADEHFLERVSGQPLNPPPSWVNWPYAHSAGRFREIEQFNHTYPERFWPKQAGDRWNIEEGAKYGIRYAYGDLQDVINLLIREPYTRQAYLPIFFPEDTGVVHGGRVPCTLGYHFLIRDGRLSVFYPIRSCDFIRHFRDDVYLCVRLLLHVLDHVRVERRTLYLATGDISMWIGSLHCFVNDWRTL